MLSLRVDSSKYQVLWSDAEGPAVGSYKRKTHLQSASFEDILLYVTTEYTGSATQVIPLIAEHPIQNYLKMLL